MANMTLFFLVFGNPLPDAAKRCGCYAQEGGDVMLRDPVDEFAAVA